MVKLAEPRQRNRYTLVPRGKALYEDDDRFGTKMLEKMGWSKGKGLGANENGSKDFVRIRYKNDAQGLGFEARDDQWTQHEQSFNGLLESLNGNNKGEANGDNNDVDSDVDMRPVGFGFTQSNGSTDKTKPSSFKSDISGQSLEEKSKNSRARVHYKKFTRGKDLTQYSEKDLANIFGKKAMHEVSNNETTSENNHNNENNENTEENQGHFQCSTLSIVDYFKEKMEKLGKQKQSKNSEKTVISDGDKQEVIGENNDKNRKGKKKRKRDAEEVEDLKDEILLEESEKQKKKKKKQKKSKDSDSQLEVLNVVAEEGADVKNIDKNIPSQQNCETNNDDHNVKKRKKSKKPKKNYEQEKIEETEFLEQTEKENVEDATISCNETNDLEAKKSKKEKKKKKNKHDVSKTETAVIPEPTITQEKKSKKRKLKDGSKSEAMPEIFKDLREDVSSKEKSKSDTENNLDEKTITVDYKNIIPEDNESFTKIKEIENELEAAKVYKISSFAAEQFRFTDISGFSGSNLSDIKGYGVDDDVQLEIVENEYDAKRISQLWSCTIDKYQFLTRPYSLFNEYNKKAFEARKNKEKIPRFKVHQYRRKDAFKGVTI